MDEIKWEEPPTDQRRGGEASAMYLQFAAALRGRPGEWAVLSEDCAQSMVTNIKRGAIVAFRPEGHFDARSLTVDKAGRRVKLFVRYVGESA